MTASLETYLLPGSDGWWSVTAECGGATNGVIAVGVESARAAGLALMGRWCLDRGAVAATLDGESIADLKAAVEGWEAELDRQATSSPPE